MQYNKASWLSLAQSSLEADRKYALEMALVNAENFQEELLFWFHQYGTGLRSKLNIYAKLEEESRISVFPKTRDVISSFIQEDQNFSNKENPWLILATSNDLTNKELALELLKGNPLDYQAEILHWLNFDHSYHIFFLLYTLLTEEHQARFYQQDLKPIIPPRIWTDGSFEIYLALKDPLLKQSILLSILYKRMPLKHHKINFIKNYRTVASCSLREAKDATDKLWDDPRWQNNQ